MARVLVVDDEISVRLVLREFLEEDGHDVETAEDAEAALDLLGREGFDVVLSDIILPRMNGVDLLHAIRAGHKRVQVIIMTGNPAVDTARAAVAAGAFDYLSKPFSAREVVRCVENAAKVKAIDDEREALAAANRGHLQDLERLVVEFRLAKQQSDAANRAKSEFLASVSHELRTPLNAIIGFSELLEDRAFGPLNEDQARYVATILKSGRHLLALINDIMDLSKVEAGKMELVRTPVAAGALFEESLGMVGQDAVERSIAIHLDMVRGLRRVMLNVDEAKLRQVMYNLLSNAVKFTPDGGTIRVKAELCDPSAVGFVQDRVFPGEVSRVLCVSVADTGIGIAPDDLERIFGRFEQAGEHSSVQQPGTGLGLALVRRLVELHGGRVRAESEGGGKGSTFVFTIPDAVAPAESGPDAEKRTPSENDA